LKPLAAALAAIVAAMAALACASALPPASPETEGGRALYAGKCHSCHRLYAPSRVSAEKWPALMEKMAVKAKLTPEEEQAILAYVLSAAPAK
jgi:mono/diheme cytochrome c family protein